MSERKVLNKYYPPEFDPQTIPRRRRPGNVVLPTVRLEAPFSMKCTSCGEYIGKGRKFNARKETTDEKYLNINIIRFYIRCTRCSAEITFTTDWKNTDYRCETGAKRGFELWRDEIEMAKVNETDEERLVRREREAEAEEEEGILGRNRMEELEKKRMENEQETHVADALDGVRMRNARLEKGEHVETGESAMARLARAAEEQRSRANQEDDEITRKAFMQAKAPREQSRRKEFSWDVHRGLKRRAVKPPVVSSVAGKTVVKASLGLNYGSDSD